MTGALIRTPDQRLRVFVSSTLAELAEERAAVRKAIERLQLTPVLFEFGARPHPPRKLYRAYLEQSQIFIGIYWQRYGGWRPTKPSLAWRMSTFFWRGCRGCRRGTRRRGGAADMTRRTGASRVRRYRCRLIVPVS